MKLRIKRFDKSLALPEAEPSAVGFDLHCRESVTIAPHTVELIPVNVTIEIPKGYALIVAVRSSTPLKKGLIMANSIGIIDPFYSGDRDEIKVQLLNFTDMSVEVEKGELLTQGFVLKHETVDWQEVDSFGKDGHGGYWA